MYIHILFILFVCVNSHKVKKNIKRCVVQTGRKTDHFFYALKLTESDDGHVQHRNLFDSVAALAGLYKLGEFQPLDSEELSVRDEPFEIHHKDSLEEITHTGTSLRMLDRVSSSTTRRKVRHSNCIGLHARHVSALPDGSCPGGSHCVRGCCSKLETRQKQNEENTVTLSTMAETTNGIIQLQSIPTTGNNITTPAFVTRGGELGDHRLVVQLTYWELAWLVCGTVIGTATICVIVFVGIWHVCKRHARYSHLPYFNQISATSIVSQGLQCDSFSTLSKVSSATPSEGEPSWVNMDRPTYIINS